MIEVLELRELLGLGDDTSKDDQLARLEAGAVSFIELQTGQVISVTAAATVYARGNGLRDLYLPATFATITTVTERTYPGDTGVAITDFVVRPGLLRRTGGAGYWPWDYEYEITGNRGYAAEAAPDYVKQLVRDLVVHAYKTDGGTLKSEGIGGYSYTRAAFSENEWSMIEATLHMMRGPVVA